MESDETQDATTVAPEEPGTAGTQEQGVGPDIGQVVPGSGFTGRPMIDLLSRSNIRPRDLFAAVMHQNLTESEAKSRLIEKLTAENVDLRNHVHQGEIRNTELLGRLHAATPLDLAGTVMIGFGVNFLTNDLGSKVGVLLLIAGIAAIGWNIYNSNRRF
ncbi:MAG: hypothetical protein ACOYXR_02295 [Nitrospirota bacterium]